MGRSIPLGLARLVDVDGAVTALNHIAGPGDGTVPSTGRDRAIAFLAGRGFGAGHAETLTGRPAGFRHLSASLAEAKATWPGALAPTEALDAYVAALLRAGGTPPGQVLP